MDNIKVMHSTPYFVSRVERLTANQRDLIVKTGFGNLLFLPKHNLSKTLLTQLIDKWNSDSLAFQLADSEISMTLLDVALILGLPVTGQPVIFDQDEPFSDLEGNYQANPGTRKISCEYLEKRLDSLGDAADDDFTRTFLLFTFATFLFRGSRGDVDSRYLIFLRDLDSVPRYAWGVAVLEDLTMWVSNRQKNRAIFVGGCMAFLQIWFYEHVNMARPALQKNSRTFPRACRWEESKSYKYRFIQTEFEKLEENQIIRELQPTAIELEDQIIREFLAARMDVPQETVLGAQMDEPQMAGPRDNEVDLESGQEKRDWREESVAFRRLSQRLISSIDRAVEKLNKMDEEDSSEEEG